MLSDDTKLSMDGGDETDPLALAKKRLQQFPAQQPGGLAIAPGTGELKPPDWTAPDDPGFNPYTPEPIKNDTPVLKATPDASTQPLISPQSTNSGPTMAAPAAPSVAPPPVAPPPPPPSGTPLPSGFITPQQGVAQGYVPPATPDLSMTNAPQMSAPALDPAMVAKYRQSMASVLPLGSDPVSEDFIRADIARTEAAQKAASQPGYQNITPEERDAMTKEEQIAKGLFVQGDPNNKGFGGIAGVDPTGGAPARTLQGGLEQYADGSAVPGGYNAQTDALKQLADQGYAGMNVTPDGSWSSGTGQDGAPMTPGTTNVAPTVTPGATPAAAPPPSATPRAPVSTAATDTTPSTPVSPRGIAPVGSETASAPVDVNSVAQQRLQDFVTRDNGLTQTSPITPDGASDLLSTAITPGTGVDRFGLAQKRFADWRTANDPTHDARVRKIIGENGAALGRLGSGMLNTDVGNEQLAYDREQGDLQQRLLNDALEGTIGDSRSNRAELRGERGYQSGLEDKAYGRSVDEYKLGQDADARAFDEAMRRAQFGEQGNPSGLDVAAGAAKRQTSADDMRNYQQLVSGLTQKSAAGDQTASSIIDWLRGIVSKGGDSSAAMDAILKALPSLKPQLTPSAAGG